MILAEEEDEPVHPIGDGKSSLVYRGKLKGHDHEMAFKLMRSSGSNWIRSLESELKTLVAIGRHKHILYFVGLSKQEVLQPVRKL